MNICIFGDSIAFGANDDKYGGWASRLTDSIQKQHEKTFVYNLAIPGETTASILERLDSELSDHAPDVVIIALGINDSLYVSSSNDHDIPLDEFKRNVTEIISKTRQHTDQLLWVGPTPVEETKTNPIPFNQDWSFRMQDIELYNETLIKICTQEQVAYIDLMDELKQTGFSSYLPDGVHPDTQGHELLYGIIRSAIKL